MNSKISIARKRALLIQGFRNFFAMKHYLEVETPLLSPFLLPEPAIEVFSTEFINGYGKKNPCYLIPSPELWMKRLLAVGFNDIYQICRCFRNGESIGSLHNPEFTMCEWYSVNANYMDSLTLTEELLHYLSQSVDYSLPVDLTPPFLKLSMKEAFWEYLDMDLDELLNDPFRIIRKKKLTLMITESSSLEEIFNTFFLTYIEPNLPKEKPLFLYDYPCCIPVLAKKKKSLLYYERWELYISGNEIANCYTEETDGSVIRDFIKKEAERKQQALVCHKIDRRFDSFFPDSYPACSGVALGIDRLFMTILGLKSIEGVILFPFSDIMNGKFSDKEDTYD